MKLSTSELMIVEMLLQNKATEDYDKKVEELLTKVKKEIGRRNYELNRVLEWGRAR